jgi:hypothetical protein
MAACRLNPAGRSAATFRETGDDDGTYIYPLLHLHRRALMRARGHFCTSLQWYNYRAEQFRQIMAEWSQLVSRI